MPRCCKRRVRLARTWRWRGWTKQAFALATTGAGSAVLEVTQGRQPCWKPNLRFGVPDMSARVKTPCVRAFRYCRTLQDGVVQAGDALEPLERPCPGWTVQRLLALIRDRECHPACTQR